MHGGKILYSIDQVSAELDSLRGHGGEQLTFNKQLNLDDQLFTYGVRINYDLLADMNCAQIPVTTGNVSGQAQIQMVPWCVLPIFVPTSKHPIVKTWRASVASLPALLIPWLLQAQKKPSYFRPPLTTANLSHPT